MPIIKSSYKTSLLFQNPHIATIYASVFRKVNGINYTRKQLQLSDGDTIDLDWSYTEFVAFAERPEESSKKLVIITHGFLGNSDRQYVKGTVKIFNKNGWDALAWNHRGLGGTPSKFEKMTLHGSIDELTEIVDHVLKSGIYSTIALVGWSKGGNITLKYVGAKGNNLPKEIKVAVGISMPTDLLGSVSVMGKTSFYVNRFRDKTLKFLQKRKHLIDSDKYEEFKKYKILDDFTDWYIAPLHGFKDARDYYVSNSVLDFLPKITIPTLILNALDDPLLSLTCSPFQFAEKSDIIHLETPKNGGHCAFYESNSDGVYWAEKRVLEFVNNIITNII